MTSPGAPLLLLGAFPAAYVNVVLNGSLSPDAGSKLVVDDRVGSQHGAKLVVGAAAAFEAGLVAAGGAARVLKIKGALGPKDVATLAAVLERHLPSCPALTAVSAKGATFLDGGDGGDGSARAAALEQLAAALVHHAPPGALVNPGKGGPTRPAEEFSPAELASALLAAGGSPAEGGAAPGGGGGGWDPRAAKLKLKLGCLDAAGAGGPASLEALDAMLADAALTGQREVRLPVPPDAVCCAGAGAGGITLRIAATDGIKLRGRLSAAAVGRAVAAAGALPAGPPRRVAVVRHTADADGAAALVGGLAAAAPARGMQLVCKREDDAAAAPTVTGKPRKEKRSWALRPDGAWEGGQDAIVAFVATTAPLG